MSLFQFVGAGVTVEVNKRGDHFKYMDDSFKMDANPTFLISSKSSGRNSPTLNTLTARIGSSRILNAAESLEKPYPNTSEHDLPGKIQRRIVVLRNPIYEMPEKYAEELAPIETNSLATREAPSSIWQTLINTLIGKNEDSDQTGTLKFSTYVYIYNCLWSRRIFRYEREFREKREEP